MPINGRKVEHYRIRQGKTRKQLADASGYSYSMIAQIENARKGTGSEKSAKAIADALGLTIDDIWLDRKR